MTAGRRRGAPARDQNESAFAAILADLLKRVPGGRAAALVDRDGETVDYAGARNPYEMKVAAAHFRIVLDQARSQPLLAATSTVLLRASRASFAVHALPEGYALVLWLARGAGFRGLGRSVPVCARRLAAEAGWSPIRGAWHPVDVEVDGRNAPRALLRAGGTEVPLEILGRFRAALPEGERAWRVRLATGVELTLVRETGGFWYADEPTGPIDK
jgi:hypothetical protein